MNEHEQTARRIAYAAESVMDKSVMTMNRSDWIALVRNDGTPTLLNEAPDPCSGVMKDAIVVAVAASGDCNPQPGFDIARLDQQDAPYIYNIDHYDVLERFSSHPDYQTIRTTAGIDDSPQLRQTLDQNVFVVKRGPAETSDHWCKQLPERINISRHK